jgi:plastocyanin
LRNHTRSLTAAVIATACLAPGAVAGAATKDVSLGYGGAPPKGAPQTASPYAFFPHKVKIHAGDKVRYSTFGFGVVYSGPKSKIQGLAQLDDANKVSGLTDPLGAPFWFDGQVGTPQVNPFYLAPAGDGKVHKGQKDVDHGVLPEDRPVPYTLRFSKPGSYKIYDALHPKVFNRVVVVPKGKKIPGAAHDRAAVAKQLAKLVKQAR